MKEQDYFRVHNKAVTLLKTILKENFCEQVYNFKLKNWFSAWVQNTTWEAQLWCTSKQDTNQLELKLT